MNLQSTPCFHLGYGFSLRCRPGRIDASALAVVRVKRHRVRFPNGRLRQSGASACIQGSVRLSGAGSRKVERTISGAVAWPTGSRSMRACTLIALATVKRGRRNWVGVFAYLA